MICSPECSAFKELIALQEEYGQEVISHDIEETDLKNQIKGLREVIRMMKESFLCSI